MEGAMHHAAQEEPQIDSNHVDTTQANNGNRGGRDLIRALVSTRNQKAWQLAARTGQPHDNASRDPRYHGVGLG